MIPQDAILFHGGYFEVFSNFAATRVNWMGVDWDTSEHAYQAAKFNDPHIRESVRIARSARDSKKVAEANQAYVRKDWLKVRLSIMEAIVRAKLAQHEFVQQMLLSSGDRMIIEDSPVDSYWGRGPDWGGARTTWEGFG